MIQLPAPQNKKSTREFTRNLDQAILRLTPKLSRSESAPFPLFIHPDLPGTFSMALSLTGTNRLLKAAARLLQKPASWRDFFFQQPQHRLKIRACRRHD